MFASVASTIAVILALLAYKEVFVVRANLIMHQRGWRENAHAAPKTPTGRLPLVLPPLPGSAKPTLLMEQYRTRAEVGHGNN